MKFLGQFALAIVVICSLLCVLSSASTFGTASNGFSYTVTADELASYREQVDLDVYNLVQSGGHCEPYNQSICNKVIRAGTSVFVPDSSSQEQLSKELEDAFFLLRVSRSGDCVEALTHYLCSQYFPLCTINESTLEPAANQPCYPICQRFNETCPDLVDRFALIPQQLKPLCADPGTNSCGYHVDPTETQAAIIRSCPPPLVSVTGSEGGILGGTCAEPCPILMWTESEYKKMDIMSEVLGIISLLTSAFITLTWIVFPKMRQKQYIFWFFVCSFFLSLFLWIGLRLRGSDVAASTHCKSPTEEYQMGGYCIFQGMTTIYFLISGTAWWMIQSLDIFLKVVLEIRFLDGSTESTIREIAYHVFAWGIGAVCVIGALAFEQIGGYNNGASFCLFSTGRNYTGSAPDASYGFFYYPLIVMCALGVIGIAATFIKLVIFKFSTKSAITVAAFIRIFILVITMLGVCVIIVLYKFLGADNVEKWRQSAEEFYTCLLFAKDNPFEQINCGSNPKLRMPIALKFLYDLIPIAPGILCFLCYGITAELYTSWLGLFYDKCGCACGRKYSSKGDTGSYSDKSTNGGQSKTQNSTVLSTTANQSTAGATATATKKGMFKGGMAAKRQAAGGTTQATTSPRDSNAEVMSTGNTAMSTTEMVPPSQVELQDMQ